MTPAQVIVTIALAIAVIMLGESLRTVVESTTPEGRAPTTMELVKGLVKEVSRRVSRRISRKFKGTVNKMTNSKPTVVDIEEDLPCGSVRKGLSEWTVMVTVKDEPNTFLFPTLIGERTGIATDGKHWLKHVTSYKTYIPEKRYLPFAFGSQTEFWTIKEIYRRLEKTENEVILLSFDGEFPTKLVPACLPMPGAFHMKNDMTFSITAYYRSTPADERISLYHETLVQKHDQKEGGGPMVKMEKPDHPYQRMYALSGPVMAKMGTRYILIGIMQSTDTKEPVFRKIFTDDELQWIDREAKEHGLATAKMLPPPLQ